MATSATNNQIKSTGPNETVLIRLLRTWGTIIVIALVGIGFAIASPYFATVSNLNNILFSMIVYTLIYGFLAVIEVWLFLKYAKAGLPDVAPVEVQKDPDAPLTFAY